MAKFCGKCGSRLDTTTGLCPNCDVEQLAAIRSEKFTDAGKVQEFYPDAPLLTEPNNQEVAFANPAKKDGMGNAEPVSNDRPLSKKEAKKQRKKEKKTAKKALKKGKHAQWSAGGKIGRFFLKIILILLLLAVLVVGLMEAFIYFDIADIPAIENIIKRVELLSGNNGRDIGTDDDSLLKDFTSNENYFWESEQVNVVFSVSIQGKKPDYVDLYSDDKFVCQMLDNGKNGDLLAGDGIYASTISVISDLGSINYYCKLEEHISKTIYLYFFERPTEESILEIQKIQANIIAIEETFCSDNGYIKESNLSDVMEEVEKYAKKLYKNGDVLYYEVSDNSILFKFKNGLTYMYLPKRSGIDAIGENTNISVLTLQPCLNTYSSDINEYLSLPDLSAEKISGNLPLYTFRAENNYDNQEVTLNLIKALSENQVIIWHGHGGYSNSLHSYLLTGEEFDWDAWWQNPIYCLDSLQNRIIECSNGNVAFTSKYVDKYCNNLNGTFLYLAACQSGKDNVLVDSFLGKGAEAVVANSETIYTVYNLQIQSATLNNMTQYNEKTGNLYTLEEALAMAKKEFGENDSAYGDKEEIATPLIFGGQDAENFVFHNDATSVKSKQIHYDAVEFNGHYYFLYENTNVASYNDALEYCINNGGYLATITSQEENDFVYSYIKRLGCESAYFGLSNASSEGNWQWCTGENLSYTAWHSGEPNTENSNEDYAMFYYKYNDGSWNDGDFGESTINGGNSFICEWGDYALDSGDNKMSESEKTTCVEAEELYADILDRFYYHIKSEWSTYDLEKEQDDISYLYSLYYEVYDDPKYIDNIGYSFLDLNEDGIPELLIGVYDANINKFRCSDNIYDLYTYEDGKIVHLESITGRNDCNLCDDNTIIRKDEAGYESMEYYHLCLESGEHALSIMEYVYCNFDSNSQKAYWFYETPELSNLIKDEKDKSTPISEVEANNILENWPKTIEFALTMFSSYTPKKSKTTDIPIAKINAFDLIGKDISYISDMYGEDYIDTYYALGGKCYLYEDLETLFIYDDMGKVLIVVGWHDTDYGYNLSGTTTYPDLVSKMESNNIELPLPQYGCFVYPSYYIVEFELNGYIIDYFWEDDPNISDSCEIWIHQWKSQLGHAE